MWVRDINDLISVFPSFSYYTQVSTHVGAPKVVAKPRLLPWAGSWGLYVGRYGFWFGAALVVSSEKLPRELPCSDQL